jgi:NAD(P)-dependent dehydrogenase (short-subunit alcohol dehydrogenase family)
MHLYLKGKTALVTGSTAGIGKAIAISLVEEGATVLINGRREEKVNQTIKEIQSKYPDAILQSVVADLGTEIDDNLLQHLSPLGWEHINLTGDYTWQQNTYVERGAFRPLRSDNNY